LKVLQDNDSWQDFFSTYWDLIYGVAIKSGLSDAEAQDVVQETVIQVAKNIGSFEYDASRSFKAWLLQGVKWRIADQFRRRLPAAPSPRSHDDGTRTATVDRITGPTGYELEDRWDSEWKDHLHRLASERVRARVNPRHYQVFDAYVLKEWPVERVVKTLGVTEAVVYQTKRRITEMLRKEVARLEKESAKTPQPPPSRSRSC
jgi:RNA polymerase sigma-70 factor (ECF subfamily)